MPNDTCLKCNSKNIVEVDAGLREQQLTAIKVDALSLIPVTRYVCCDCGFIEHYVENVKDIQKIKGKSK